jgi:hypothetical protein
MDDEILYSARANLLAVVSLTRQLDTLPLVMYYKRERETTQLYHSTQMFYQKRKKEMNLSRITSSLL